MCFDQCSLLANCFSVERETEHIWGETRSTMKLTFNHWKSTGGSDVGKELRGQPSIQFIKQARRNYLGTNTENY